MGIWKRLKSAMAPTRTWTSSELKEWIRAKNTRFTGDLLDNDLAMQCVQANATHTSKASARVFRNTDEGVKDDSENKRLERLLNQNPCPGYTGRDFLYRIRAWCDWKGMAFIYVKRDAMQKVTGFYPINYNGVEALYDQGRDSLLGFRFSLWNGKLLELWTGDLMIIRRAYIRDSAFGEGNQSLYQALNMHKIADKGIENAVTLTASLRGILSHEKAGIKTEDRKRSLDQFVKDFIEDDSGYGIASVDASQKYQPINMNPATVSAEQTEQIEKRIMRGLGVNDAILMNTFNENQWLAYYEGSIEPFLIALSQAATLAVFTPRERSFGNEIIWESNRLIYASTQTKLTMVQLVDRGILTPNEYRTQVLNLAPVPGGDEPVIRREYGSAEEVIRQKEPSEGGEEDGI